MSQLISTGAATSSIKGEKLETGVKTLPEFMRDATDRNRTSPFALPETSSSSAPWDPAASISGPNVVLNTIVAESLSQFADELEKAEDLIRP